MSASSPHKQSAFLTLAPISAGCMVSAGVMYPMDVVRALRMASASEAVSLPTAQLLRNFVSAHGLLGLASQGVLPEIARATAMRVVQCVSQSQSRVPHTRSSEPPPACRQVLLLSTYSRVFLLQAAIGGLASNQALRRHGGEPSISSDDHTSGECKDSIAA